MAEKKEEKRSYRFPAFLEVDLYRPDSIVSVGKGYVTDISASGLGLNSKVVFRMKEPLQIDFILADGEIIQLNSVIARIMESEYGYDYGVKFENNSESVYIRIEDFIREKLK